MAEMVFDEALRARLMAFQKASGITVDGTVGDRTWTKLVEVVPAVEKTEPKTEPKVAEPVGRREFELARVREADFPVLFDMARRCRTEEGAKEFLRTELGFDLDEALRNIESVLEG